MDGGGISSSADSEGLTVTTDLPSRLTDVPVRHHLRNGRLRHTFTSIYKTRDAG